MNYNEIIDRVANNLGKSTKSSVFLSIAKKDIYDAITKFYRKTEPIKDTSEDAITVDAQELSLSSDFFMPLEVIFNDGEGLRYPSKELEYEEYLRWNPNTEVETTSFTELVTSATPQASIYTQENADFDGLVGYVFSDTNPQKLLWKPAINGTVYIYYSTYPTIDLSDLTASPDIYRVFHNLIVDEVTIRQLVRRLGEPKSDVELYGINSQLKHYRQERDEALNDLSGFVNVNAETPSIVPFNFLNAAEMYIHNSNDAWY